MIYRKCMGLVLNLVVSIVQEDQPRSIQKYIKIKVQSCSVTPEGLMYVRQWLYSLTIRCH